MAFKAGDIVWTLKGDIGAERRHGPCQRECAQNFGDISDLSVGPWQARARYYGHRCRGWYGHRALPRKSTRGVHEDGGGAGPAKGRGGAVPAG